jgi:hypothetical protein
MVTVASTRKGIAAAMIAVSNAIDIKMAQDADSSD